jgi:hypothetical protein
LPPDQSPIHLLLCHLIKPRVRNCNPQESEIRLVPPIDERKRFSNHADDASTQKRADGVLAGAATSEGIAGYDNIVAVFDALPEVGVGVLEAVLAEFFVRFALDEDFCWSQLRRINFQRYQNG